MPTITRGLYKWIFKKGAILEDFADRLNHFWTFTLLLIFSAIISWKQGSGYPMVCWTPAEFTDEMVRFTNSHCWHSHYIRYGTDISKAMKRLNETSFLLKSASGNVWPIITFEYPSEPSLMMILSTTTTLYQWIPLILVFQALLFKLPNLVMYCCHGYSGLSFDKLNGLTEGHKRLNMADRGVLCKQISRYIYNWCNQGCNVLPWRCISVAWLLTKVLFLINIVTQIFFLNRYLRTFDPPFDLSSSYGDVIMDNLFTNNGSLWKMSPVFPRNVLCDFQIRQLWHIQRYSCQCDIPTNEYSEVAYIVIWVWLVFVATVTCVSFVVWLVQVAVPVFRQRYIRKMLRMSEEFAHVTSNETDGFADWIGEDGVMALKLIGSNSSDLVVCDVICNMWRRRQAESGTSITGSVQQQQQQQQHQQPQQSSLRMCYPRTDPGVRVDASGGPPLYPDIAIETKLQ